MIKNIIITLGEPAGIGPEIIEQSLLTYKGRAKFLILGDQRCFSEEFIHKCHFISNDDGPVILEHDVNIMDFPLAVLPVMGKPLYENAPILLEILSKAVLLCHGHPDDFAMVTAPLQKEIIAPYDHNFLGHTDFIADILSIADGKKYHPVMMLTSNLLTVVPLTVHIPLMEVSKYITAQTIENTLRIIHDDYYTYHKKPPRIAVTGLNPHAGDMGIMGREEIEIIQPALESLEGTYILSGPHAADSLFHEKARQHYDIALCMYHDQALIPIKTLAFDVGVNATIGLPIIRTSPDHGTALNIAGQSEACPKAMMAAINYAEQRLLSR